MKEQFDRALRNHIRDTFDHYDDLMADDGWEKFQKQKNIKKRGLIFWYGLPSGIAAALALLWLFNATSTDLVKTENNLIAQNKVTTATPVSPKSIEDKAETPLPTQKKESSLNLSTSKSQLKFGKEEPLETFINASIITERAQLALVNTKSLYFARFETEDKEPNLSLAKQNIVKERPLPINNTDYLAFNTALLANTPDYQRPNLKEEKSVDKKKDSPFNFAVDANTYYSFTSAGVNDDLNMGIGVLSELKLSKRLSVNSGISINKQSTIYQKSQNNGSQEYTGLAAPNSLVSSSSKQSISVPEEVKTSAKLVGFDIPINLKYNLPIGKVKSFISGGVSSYSLLNQSYVNDVSIVNYSLTSEPTTTILRNVEEEKEGAFSNFQFARTLNFSFGILYPVSSKNSISVEPFVKYPIAGFGNQDLEIGSGGISFKLNFGK